MKDCWPEYLKDEAMGYGDERIGMRSKVLIIRTVGLLVEPCEGLKCWS